jgi:CubicO group peptidase (beta-lactamase class C family)/beta-lactamase regulating signal transducer with metallopeptidase domain
MTPTGVLLDALLVGSTAGVLPLVMALAVSRSRRSPHLRHLALWGALITSLGVFGAVALVHPGKTGCLLRSCADGAEPRGQPSQAHEFYTVGAAGKFRDLAPAPVVPPTAWHRSEALGAVWLAGFLFMLGGMARRRRSARCIMHEALPVTDPAVAERLATLAAGLGLDRLPAIAWHPRVAIPSVAGSIRPTLLLPEGFASTAAAEQEMVLLHELAHVRRRDGLMTLLGELAVACFWFHPVVRLAAHRLGDLQELAADSHVLRGGVRPSSYARFLVKTFRHASESAAGVPRGVHAILGACQIELRVRTILDPRSAHGMPSRWLRAALALLLVLGGAGGALIPAALHALAEEQIPQSIALQRALITEQALDSLLRPVVINHMADRYIAGAAVAVVHEGKVVYRAGFGRREVFQEDPVNPDETIWRIGSVTKVLTGAAVLQLVDRGSLDLDADVNRYLTTFTVPATYSEPVRVRHLLTHTAGFDQIGLGRHATSAERTRPLGEFLRDNLIRIRPPGRLATYDTYGITLAGHLVEQRSGLSYEDFLRRNLFGPLRMDRSGIAVPPQLAGDVAIGYGFTGTWTAEPWEYMNTDPASTVNATVVDMAHFAIMLLERGRFDGRQVLSETVVRAMFTRQFTNHPEHPGYSFTLFEDRSYGIPAFSHGGSMTGYGAFLYLVPEHRLGVFIALNQESGSLPHLVISRLVDSLFPGHPPVRRLRERLQTPVRVARFAGRYANSMYHHTDPTTGWRIRPIELTVDDKGLLVFDGAPAYPVGPLSFQRDDGVLLSFVEDERGAIAHFVVNQTVYERLR